MKARTESEVKAYADGYKACYKEFCQCLKNNTAEQAIKKMGMFVVVVSNCVEVAEQTEPKPCEECKHYLFTDVDGYYCEHETYGQRCGYEPKTEPQTDCDGCIYLHCNGECGEVEDEPSTDCSWK